MPELRLMLAIVFLVGLAASALAARSALPEGDRQRAAKQSSGAKFNGVKISIRVGRRVGSNQEFLLSCNGRSKLLTFNLIDRRYCDAKMRCSRQIHQLIGATCSGRGLTFRSTLPQR